MIKIKKNFFIFFQFIFISSFLFSLINSAYTTESMKSDQTKITGVGTGVMALIIIMCISVLICIFGQSTASPMLFILIGFMISLLTFIFLISIPIKVNDGDDKSKNRKKNYYIIARYFYFIVMLLLFLGIVGPFIILWTKIIIPERVDSRAQKVYEEKLDEKYLSSLKEERKLLEENNNEGNENNQDLSLSLNNQLPLPRTFNSNTGHSSGLPALRRRNMNENNPGVRRRRRNNENNYNNSNHDNNNNNNLINNQ